jgi:DNA-3-methyladenine glycosylase II
MRSETPAFHMETALVHLSAADPVLAAIIQRVGPYRLELREPGFGTLVRSIIYQQLSGRVASTILERFRAAMPDGQLTPEGVVTLSTAQMRAIGLSGQKSAYLRDLAEKTLSGEVDFPSLPTLPDAEVIEHLTRVKGVGVWTAHMFLMFALGRPDVLPTGDLGVRAAMKKAYRMRALPKPERMEKIARRWRPWCSVASWYLWRSLENEAAL